MSAWVLTIEGLIEFFAIVVGFAGVVAGGIATVMFVRTKSNLEALRATVETYKELADARDKKIEAQEADIKALQQKNTELTLEVSKLRGTLEAKTEFSREWTAILIDAIAESALCEQAHACPSRIQPTPGVTVLRDKPKHGL